MAPLLSLLALAAGPLVALAAGVAGWGCARALAPRAAANDNAARLPPRQAPGADRPPANDVSLRLVAVSDAAG